MLSVLAFSAACLAALGTLALTWACTRAGWAALRHEIAAGDPVNVVTVTIRHTSIAPARGAEQPAVIYRPEFAATKARPAPFAARLRVLRAAA